MNTSPTVHDPGMLDTDHIWDISFLCRVLRQVFYLHCTVHATVTVYKNSVPTSSGTPAFALIHTQIARIAMQFMEQDVGQSDLFLGTQKERKIS